uniref:Uncharacterized protein LOC100374304 n=1 Tax=Saccoglossus kowalevskii TaxID=10224 RepID=A0ABM0LXL0_SACKO|nr:PREDICTED: uncharacterized protein LOC100374304 [Saccoglossus kowalevskii]
MSYASQLLCTTIQAPLQRLPLFYCELLQCWKYVDKVRKFNDNNVTDILNEPLFNNALIIHPIRNEPFALRHFVDAGITKVCDLVSETNKTWLEAADMSDKIKIHSERILHLSIKVIHDSIPTKWKDTINTYFKGNGKCNQPLSHQSFELHFSDELNLPLYKFEKGAIYKYLIRVQSITQHLQKLDTVWRDILSLPESAKPNFKDCYETPVINKYGDLQWRIVHGAFPTGRFLFKARLNNSDKCPFCDEVDTLQHIFYDCPSNSALLHYFNNIASRLLQPDFRIPIWWFTILPPHRSKHFMSRKAQVTPTPISTAIVSTVLPGTDSVTATTTLPATVSTTESVPKPRGQKLVIDASSDVSVTTPMPEMQELSACLWLKTKVTNKGTPISYAVSGSFSEFVLYDTSNLEVFVRLSGGGNSGIFVHDNEWHHLCVTWSSNGGRWRIYDNGALGASGFNLQSGNIIRGGGVLIIGQEQDSLGGGYDSSQALKGEMTFFNMYSRILSDDEIGQLAAECNGETEGDLFAWSLDNLDLGGSVEVLEADICLEWTGDEKLVVNAWSDVAIRTPIPELREFSACLWVKTKETNQGTPISYAISGSMNEFILIDTSDLRVVVRDSNGGNSGIGVNDDDWHHLCVTWSFNGGMWGIYDDGALAASGSSLQSGYVIQGGGVLILGQEQDSLRGGYESSQTLKGELTYFNMWSRILSDDEIGQLAAECNGETEGDLFAWSSGDIDLDGRYETLPADVCFAVPWTGTEKIVVDASSDVAITTPIPELRDVSACLWIKTKETNKGTPISYAVSGSFSEFVLYDTSNLQIYVQLSGGGKNGISVHDNDWHHLCVTWSSSGGLWRIYDNGVLATAGSDLESDNVIRGGGVLVLGQEQDSLRGGYESTQAFKGEMAYFNMWGRILSDDEIGQLAAECNGETEGDLFAWSSGNIDLDGSYETLPADICLQWTGDEKLVVDVSSDVAIRTPIPELSELTACLWVKTKESNQGTPISYAISGSFNEFSLFDTTDLRVVVRDSDGGNSGIDVNDNDWHHLCVTWSSNGGLWEIFDNGVLVAVGSGLRSGYVIRADGVLVLGQEQDSLRGGYESSQALKGEIAYFNMWSRILSDEEIEQLAEECNGETEGDLFAWSSGDIDLDGTYETFAADICIAVPWTGNEKIVVDASSDVAITTPIPELSDVSACLWVKTAEANQGTPLSYAISGGFNEFNLFDTSDLKVSVRESSGRNSGISVNDNVWHHLCVTWSSSDGLWGIYDNGNLAESGSGLEIDKVIRGGGVLVLGQEQDSLRGGYESSQALKGEMAHFNMWSRILSDNEIGQIAADCNGETEGALFAWSSGDIDLDGTYETFPADLCLTPAPTTIPTSTPTTESETTAPVITTTILTTVFTTESAQGARGEKLLVDASSDVAVTTPIPEMSELSACLWLKTKVTNKGTPISYAVSGSFSEFVLYDTSNLELYVRLSGGGDSGISVHDNEWHHLCVTWSSNGGTWAIYDNGGLGASGLNLRSGSSIRGGGVLIIGQEQDSLGGGYDSNQALKGEMTYFNMWSRILSDDEIGQLAAECNGETEGDLFAWSLDNLDLGGSVEALEADICLEWIGDEKLVVDASSDVAIRTSIPEMSELTACLWVKTKETNQGTPISYAISGSYNEFTLFDTTDLRVVVRDSSGGNSGIDVNDDDWHHLCATWSSNGGIWGIYDDGALAASGSGLRSGSIIRGSGVLVLGQEQDSFRGGYQSSQALKGELAYFNTWSRILSEDEIGHLAAECNGETEGDLFAWSSGEIDLDGRYETLPADVCFATPWTGNEKIVVDTSSDVAITTPIPELRDVSACLWVKTKETNKGTPISYAISGSYNEFNIFDTSDLKVHVRDSDGRNTGIAVNDNDWHHLCVTWSSIDGIWGIHDGGALAASGFGLQSGNVIREGGVLVLGQDQDSLRGGYESSQALKGELAYFNMWSRILSDDEIGQLAAECNGETEGDLFAWSSGNIDLDGGYETLQADICLQWVGNEKLVVGALSDVAIRTPIPELSELFACMWVKTKETNQGTPISYAISGSYNEFILFDTSNLEVVMRDTNGGNSGIAVNDDEWHHVCVTWSSNGGIWGIYDDGALTASGSGLRSGSVIRGGGVLILGQEQDSLRGGYESSQTLKGELAYFNMWSRILTDDEIGQLAAECNGDTEGDLFAWSSADIDLDGTLEKLPSDVCQ